MRFLEQFGTEAWKIFLQMSPYLLFGFILAGILNIFITKQRISKHLGKKGIWSSVKATLLGIPLPLCSCGVIPTGVSFYKNGASKGATNSFLISTPQTGVDSLFITYSMLNIYWVIYRPIVALITGILGGFLTDKLVPQGVIETTSTASHDQNSKNRFRQVFSYAFIDFLGDISRQLLVGILIAVLIALFVPPNFFTNYLNYPILNMLLILIASIPLYVCATGSVPIGTALLAAGVSPGAVLVFLMAGPATNAATLTVLWKSIGKKATLIYLFSIVFGALVFGFLIDYGLNDVLFTEGISVQNHIHNEFAPWFSITTSIILILLILNVEIRKLISSKIETKNMDKIYRVEGMSCNHCKNSVETNLMKLEGITNVVADPNKNLVVIEGTGTSPEIETTINQLGFVFKGENSQ